MSLRQISRASHVYRVEEKAGKIEQWVFLCPDIHWDNPHCDRALLKKHLDHALKIGARVLMPGDTFCLMQGKYDPRGKKSDIRPEHNVDNYLDRVIQDAVDFFLPYHGIIDVVGLGNHEQSILKRQETDVVDRFVQGLNMKAGGEHSVRAGGYGGWYTLQFASGQCQKSYRIKYFHGASGSSPVTKGTIEHNRMAAHIEGADCIVIGHSHNDYEVTYQMEYMDRDHKPQTRSVLMLRCSTYKDEFADGHSGYHVERGRGPRPIGGRFLSVNFCRGRAGAGRTSTPPSVTAFSQRAI